MNKQELINRNILKNMILERISLVIKHIDIIHDTNGADSIIDLCDIRALVSRL